MKTTIARLVAAMLVFSSPFLAWGQGLEKKGNPKIREIHDSDGDGWCDLWCSIFQVEHRSRKKDSDGDGQSDYAEMLAMTNPNMKEALPGQIKKQNPAVLRKAQQEQRKALREQLAQFVVTGNAKAKSEKALKDAKKEKRQAKLNAFRAKMALEKPAKEARVQNYVNRFGVPKSGVDANGRSYVLESPDGIFVDRKITYNTVSADSISTDEVLVPISGMPDPEEFNLTGANQVLGIWDGGNVILNHVAMNGRVRDRDDDITTASNHASHVSGTMISDGTGNAATRGMSPAALLDAYDFTDDVAEIVEAIVDEIEDPNDPNAVPDPDPIFLSNHSYGFNRGWDRAVFFQGQVRWIWRGRPSVSEDEDFQFGYYSEQAKALDEIAYDYPTWLGVYAAGNERNPGDEPTAAAQAGHIYFDENGDLQFSDEVRTGESAVNGGYDTINDQAVAKNALAIAATNDVVGGYTNAAGVVMSTFSSWGPPDDGRVKPDLAANGVGLLSLDDDSTTDTYTESGTSMAAPSVTGSINLLRELHESDLNLGEADEVLASTWKALVIHTADETGDHPGPDYRFGWGLMNTLTAANLMDAHAAEITSLPNIKEVRLENGDFVEFTVIAKGGEPLKVTTCWTDPEGNIPPAALDANVPALVNDLDLRVSDGSNTFFPWKLDPAMPTNAASRNSDNNRDNVEQVLIDNPVAGQEYTVKIDHKGTLHDDDAQELGITPQLLSIIISGVNAKEAPELQIAELLQTDVQEYTAVWKTVVGDRYNIESSDNLENGSWTVEFTDIRPTKEITALPLQSGGNTRKFWRAVRTK